MEREYIIPLREKGRPVPRYKKTPKAVKTVKEFLVKHMKIRDRDLNKIKIDMFVNEALWFRGIKNPPHKIKVRAIKQGDIVKVELVNIPEKLKYKEAREKKIEEKSRELLEKKKTMMQKAKEGFQQQPISEQPAHQPVQTEEEKKEEKEKAKAGAEAGEKMKKAAAKTAKHQSGGNVKQPKRQVRKALAK
ncbi:50S ribosomal protein L31e [Candidatus Pacearchaeota archaeon]|nr:50S ribosomal protein L31e [Candidatus Pacearchaeota archaeon]